MKLYCGIITALGPDVMVRVHGASRGLAPRHDLYNHSPDGFAWGYPGSGPAQLALAILADHAGDEDALRYYQRFKDDVIARLPIDKPWSFSVSEVAARLARYKQEDGMTISFEGFAGPGAEALNLAYAEIASEKGYDPASFNGPGDPRHLEVRAELVKRGLL